MGAAASLATSATYSVPVSGSAATDRRTEVRRHPDYAGSLVTNFPSSPAKNAWDVFQRGVAISADRPCLGTREILPDGKRGEFKWKTYREVERLALQFGSGLLRLNLVPLLDLPDPSLNLPSLRCLAIFAKNREEWIIAEQACNAYLITIVPLYDTLGPQSTKFILQQTGLKTVVCGGECVEKVLDALQEQQQDPSVDSGAPNCHVRADTVICLDSVTEGEKKRADGLGVKLIGWADVIKAGEEIVPLTDDVQPDLDSVSTICYTSGTTGNPKGVVMTHGNLVAVLAGSFVGPLSLDILRISADDVVISYLPLAHVYERFCENAFFAVGARVGFYSGDTQKLLEDVQLLKPTVFCSVPRLFQRIDDRVLGSMQAKSAPVRALFKYGLAAKVKKLRTTGIPTHAFWDNLIFGRIRDLLGGRVRFMLTGSAALEPQVLERMRAFFCCPIVEVSAEFESGRKPDGGRLTGYGMTESMGASFLSWDVYDRTPGHVGGCTPCLEFCLFDVSDEMPQYSIKNEKGPQGELCIRGPTVFLGYFRNEKETADAKTQDGWLRTGDIVQLQQPSGAIKIIDRKKNIFKLAQGEYVAPEKIESVYVKAPLVAQCFVFGFSSESALVAVVVPDDEQLLVWWRQRRGDGPVDKEKIMKVAASDTELHSAIFEQMREQGKLAGLKGFEIVKKIHIHMEPFTVENGMLTPTFKLKRHAAKTAFDDAIKRMYEELHVDAKKAGQ